MNDARRMPIAFGSAWHIEEDADTEAPTSYRPTQFFANQLHRASVGYVRHAAVEESGLFPWRTLDWLGWIQHPETWAIGIRLALAFQKQTTADIEARQKVLSGVAAQCKRNEQFYLDLDKEVGGGLLLAGNGSVIVARNADGIADLKAMQANLVTEGRTLNILSKEELQKRYGFAFQGLMFGEKVHDRVLSPNFMSILTQHIQKQGGNVMNATLTTVYANDGQQFGGVAEYCLPNGKKELKPFSHIILSLGSQPIVDAHNKPLFDVVAARGVSVLAHVSVPRHYQLPPVTVCGGTNHVTKLSEKPVAIRDTDGKDYDLYLMRMTAGACITPNVSDANAANYDGTIALGLVTSARQTFGNQCKIEPITVYGCNRQVSRYGQTQWINPVPYMHVQYGAGGGGLTRAPDFAIQLEDNRRSVANSLRR